jgi:hypothetical protein
MKKERVLIFLAALALAGCGGKGPTLSTPKNLAGTRSVVLPEYEADAAAPVAQKRAPPEKIDLEIREKLFIAQTNDVYLNPEDYMGKVIKLEGLFKVQQYVGEEKQYCFVLRFGPGCCGNDGSAGFEVAWGKPQPYAGPGSAKTLSAASSFPKENAWVEAIGSLDSYEEDGYPYLFLNLFSLTEKEERGAEFVSQ